MKIDSAETWRVFCAIELPETVRELVLLHIERLRESVPQAKASWAQDTNLHLTVKFLGDIAKSSVAEVSKAAAGAVARQRPFSIRLEKTGAFPSHGPPRVLWIGVNDMSATLARLHARLEDEAALVGFAKEKRPFHPHLTVARLRQPEHMRALTIAHKQSEFPPVEVAVSDLLVIRSELSKEGSNYTVLSRHTLPGVR